jgi:uncharacterized protein
MTGPAVDRLEVRPDVGSAAWISCAGHLPFGQPGDQRGDDAWSLTYDWELDRELEILGHPRLAARVGASAPVAFLSAKLCDVFPDGTSALVAPGVPQPDPAAVAERAGAAGPRGGRAGRAGAGRHLRVFPAGHRLRLSLAGSDWPNIVPPPGPVTLGVERDGSTLTLPVVDGPSPAPPPSLPRPDPAARPRPRSPDPPGGQA